VGAFLSVDELKAFTNSTRGDDRPDYEGAILAAEQTVRTSCGRDFAIADVTPSTRVFRPRPEWDWLNIDDCVEVVTLAENGVTLVNAVDFVLEPANGRRPRSGEAIPYHRAVRYGQNWYVDGPKFTVSISARWGWLGPNVPPLVKEATKIVAKQHLDGRDVKHGLAGLSENGGVSERDAYTLRKVLTEYGRAMIGDGL
jgi:hypothetical protein